jgi:hypothetical protein
MNGGFTLPKLFGFPIFVSWSAVVILAIVVLRDGGIDTTSDLLRSSTRASCSDRSSSTSSVTRSSPRIFQLGPARIHPRLRRAGQLPPRRRAGRHS